MMLKNWFFNFMIEDWKRRLWAIALVILLFFLSFPVAVVFVAGTRYTADPGWMQEFNSFVYTLVSKQNGWMAFITVVLALVCGTSSFSWLDSRKKVDFYHSLPIRRECLFIVDYLNGILIPAVPYFVFLMTAAGIAVTQGAASSIFLEALTGWSYFMVYYLLLYSTVVIAVVMTGNLIVGLLGTAFFFFYGPLVLSIAEGSFGTWFYTYCDDGRFFDHVNQASPFIDFCIGGSPSPGFLLTRLGIGILFTLIAFFLYRKRPSEAAGKAMAFAVSKPVIRILMVIASSMVGSLFFWNLRRNMGWAVFGLLMAGLICHCVIEIIYNFDFKKLFSHYKQLIICFIISLAALFSFRFDLFGYDGYQPDKEQIQASAVLISGLDDWVDYGKLEPYKGDGLYGDVYVSMPRYDNGNGRPYVWISESREKYLFREMKLTDQTPVLTIAAEGIRETKETKEREMREEQSLWDSSSLYGDGSKTYIEATIQYTLASGKQVSRRYMVEKELVKKEISQIFDSQEYKDSVYPVLALKQDEVLQAEYEYMGENVKFNEDKARQLLAAYQEELKDMKQEDIEGLVPVGTIRFLTEAGCVQEKWEEEQERLGKNYYSYSYNGVEEYPVYGDFTQVMALISEENTQALRSNWIDNIEHITLTDSRYIAEGDSYVSGETIEIRDPAEIQELSGLLMPSRYSFYNQFNLDSKVFLDGEAYYLSQDYLRNPEVYEDKVYDSDSVLLDVDKVPQKYLDRLDYDEMTKRIEAEQLEKP